jgi:hypothetical protein
MGDAVCRIRYQVSSVAPRADCGDDAIAALEGTTRAYGFIEEYIGHADVLTVDQGEGWEVAAYASWAQDSGDLSYEWERGYVAY